MWYEQRNPRHPRLARATVLGAIALAAYAGAAFAATGGSGIAWKSESITVPYPGPFFSGHGADLLNLHCSICHSADFVNGQPHLPLATWKVEVLKMKNVFHAPMADKDVDALAQVLFERHPAPAK